MLGRHIGKSDDELFERVRKSQWRTLFSNGGGRRDGSFPSIDSANSLVNATIDDNKSEVDLVASGSKESVFIKKQFDYKTGREAYSNDEGVVYVRDTYSVGFYLIHDTNLVRGYRVRTAYPRTDGD